MKALLEKYTSRKFLVVIGVGILVYFHPEADVKELCALAGLPGLYILVEGIRDIFASAKKS